MKGADFKGIYKLPLASFFLLEVSSSLKLVTVSYSLSLEIAYCISPSTTDSFLSKLYIFYTIFWIGFWINTNFFLYSSCFYIIFFSVTAFGSRQTSNTANILRAVPHRYARLISFYSTGQNIFSISFSLTTKSWYVSDEPCPAK